MSQQDPRPERLLASTDMVPVAGTVDVKIPIDVLWKCFDQTNLWQRWNKCFYFALNHTLKKGSQLIWCFQPIRWWFLYKFPAIATIIEVEPEGPERKVTWAVVGLPGFYSNHTYHMEDLGNGYTRFGSWEQAHGWTFRLIRFFWINHFVFVKDRSVQGCRDLEQYYLKHGKIDASSLPPQRPIGMAAALTAIAVLIALLLKYPLSVSALPPAFLQSRLCGFICAGSGSRPKNWKTGCTSCWMVEAIL